MALIRALADRHETISEALELLVKRDHGRPFPRSRLLGADDSLLTNVIRALGHLRAPETARGWRVSTVMRISRAGGDRPGPDPDRRSRSRPVSRTRCRIGAGDPRLPPGVWRRWQTGPAALMLALAADSDGAFAMKPPAALVGWGRLSAANPSHSCPRTWSPSSRAPHRALVLLRTVAPDCGMNPVEGGRLELLTV